MPQHSLASMCLSTLELKWQMRHPSQRLLLLLSFARSFFSRTLNWLLASKREWMAAQVLVHCKPIRILNHVNKIGKKSLNTHFSWSFIGINIGVIRRFPSARRDSICLWIALVGVSSSVD